MFGFATLYILIIVNIDEPVENRNKISSKWYEKDNTSDILSINA